MEKKPLRIKLEDLPDDLSTLPDDTEIVIDDSDDEWDIDELEEKDTQ